MTAEGSDRNFGQRQHAQYSQQQASDQHVDPDYPQQAPLTAEEAEWEWQRQLAQQDEPLEEDEWYVIVLCLC